MVTRDDARRLALALPGVTEGPDPMRFTVDGRPIAWRWLERIDPKRPRVPSDDVLAVRIASEHEKEPLMSVNPAVFFTEPHYDGYPAILIRLAAIDEPLLTAVLRDAWRSRASKGRQKAQAAQ